MSTSHFSGPLATELADFAATLEASASANKATLMQLRTLDRFTKETALPTGTIDEAIAMAWLAPCASRGPNTRRARYHLLRRFCRFLAKRRPGTFVVGESLRPRGRLPAPPHIYTREELRLLLDGALSLRDWERWHPCPIRSKTMHAIILLLVTSVEAIVRIGCVSIAVRTRPSLRDRMRFGWRPDDRSAAVRGDRLHRRGAHATCRRP